MTKGLKGTELEPSEEFPILFQLLTSPLTGVDLRLPNNSRKNSYPGNVHNHDLNTSKVLKLEADSSVMSEESCESDDEYMTSDSDEDRMDSCTCKNGPVLDTKTESDNSNTPMDQEEDKYPSSTTVDEEDILEKLILKKRKVSARHVQH